MTACHGNDRLDVHDRLGSFKQEKDLQSFSVLYNMKQSRTLQLSTLRDNKSKQLPISRKTGHCSFFRY